MKGELLKLNNIGSFIYLKYVSVCLTVFEIRENNHCGGVTFQAGNPEPMLKNPPSTVIIFT